MIRAPREPLAPHPSLRATRAEIAQKTLGADEREAPDDVFAARVELADGGEEGLLRGGPRGSESGRRIIETLAQLSNFSRRDALQLRVMKVLVIGASGLTGSIALRLLLDRRDEPTAFVRKDLDVAGVRSARGDARDGASLEAAVAGQDAVLSAFGPRSVKKDDLQEAFMRNLVAAMKAKGVRRLVNLSAWGAGDTRDSLPLVGKLFLRLLLADMFADKERGEEILFESGLDWINVRPGRLGNGKARGGVKASLDPKALKAFPFMTRADLAAFMVDQLRDDTWVRKSPLIGY